MRERALESRTVIFLVLTVAFILRAVYAHNIPLHKDERDYYLVAKTCSLLPDSFNIPLRSGIRNHPILTVYIVALANWIGGGSVFIIRLILVLISVFGLAGLFFLCDTFFWRRVAIIALIIGSLDRYLICCAYRMIDSSIIIAIVPWIIMQFHTCANSIRKRDWLMLGLLLGVGYNIYPLFLFLVPPFFFYLLFYPRSRKILSHPAPYMALGVLVISMLPHLVWDSIWGSPNLQYIAERTVHFGLGITPRVLLLYIGDLLISLKSTSWIMLYKYYKMYSPMYVTCNWVAGLSYLLCFLYSFRFYKKEGYAVLLFVIIGIAIPVSILFPAEPWNNFWYANMTIYPLIAVTSLAVDSLVSHRIGKRFVIALFLYLGISLVLFLGGPKWGYMSLDWEKSYVGKMDYFRTEELFGKTHLREARSLTDAMIARHPKSAIVYYYKSILSENSDAKLAWLEKALECDPGSPIVIIEQAQVLSGVKRQREAIDLLRSLISHGHQFFQVYYKLGSLEYEAGNYNEAERQTLKALTMKPEDLLSYELLFFIQDALSKKEAADRNFQIFMARSHEGPYVAYALVAEEFVKKSKFDKAAYYADKIKKALVPLVGNRSKIDPYFVEIYYNLGARYARAGKNDEAIEIFNKTIEIDPHYALAHNALAALLYAAGRYDSAIMHYDAAKALGYHVSEEFQAAIEAYRKAGKFRDGV